MEVNGITLGQFSACARDISRTAYAGNVIVARDSAELPARKSGQQRCRARLTVEDTHGPGSRTSWTGRHGPYACWHAYRDVLSLAFRRFPGAVIVSGRNWRVTYRGADSFAELYPETASVNVGSAASPVTMPNLCECSRRDGLTQTMPHTGTRPAGAAGGPATCLCAACNAIREARNRFRDPEVLTCLLCGRDAGLFSALEAHQQAAHPELTSSRVTPETRRAGVLATARRQREASEELLTDPVFGPQVAAGTRFGW